MGAIEKINQGERTGCRPRRSVKKAAFKRGGGNEDMSHGKSWLCN
jgi:hypothetical protein